MNNSPQNLMLAPATLTDTSMTVIWEKPIHYEDITKFIVELNQQYIATVAVEHTHYTFENLQPNQEYQITVYASKTAVSQLKVTTMRTRKILDITEAPYNVIGNGQYLETEKLQQAINDCPKDGIVLIPEKIKILSGAIDLKSNMTLQIDGILIGSTNPKDYIYDNNIDRLAAVNKDGLVLSRYEGWEMYCYRSLLNAGYLNSNDRQQVTCENLRITGSGSLIGGGNQLGIAMRTIYADKVLYPEYVSDGIGGRRTRGRLISLIQCKNVHLTKLTIKNPPCWTIHMIYCDTITTNGIHIESQGIDNGDGWDPDSSRNLIIFDTTFDTGDDCIAIKSGKNPEGNVINIPTENVRIFDLDMIGGNGVAIGSEQSGGVNNVTIRDCRIQNTQYGFELKASNVRGGYIRNIQVQDCVIDRFLAHSVDYNADGEQNNELPTIENISLINTVINGDKQLIDLHGFHQNDQVSAIKNVYLKRVTLGNHTKKAVINLKYCQDIRFEAVNYVDFRKIEQIVDEQTAINIQIV